MFYNDEEKEYYRVIKTNSYSDSYVKFSFITNYERLNDNKVLVSGNAHIKGLDGVEDIDKTVHPYTIDYSGINLDIDVNAYDHKIVSVEQMSRKSIK